MKRMKKRGYTKPDACTTKLIELTPEEWGEICSVPWTPATRGVIGTLFARNGQGWGDEILGCYSRMLQVNRILIAHGLPYRIRRNPNRVDQSRYRNSSITTYWFELHTVV